MQSRLELLQDFIESPAEEFARSWFVFAIFALFCVIPFLLKKKKYTERDGFRWKLWLALFPVCCGVDFFMLFVGEKACYFDLAGVLSWLGISLMLWLMLTPIIFLGRIAGCRGNWENPPASADECGDELFDMALKIGKDKREGKNTSEAEADYNRKLKNFNENGFLDDFDKL